MTAERENMLIEAISDLQARVSTLEKELLPSQRKNDWYFVVTDLTGNNFIKGHSTTQTTKNQLFDCIYTKFSDLLHRFDMRILDDVPTNAYEYTEITLKSTYETDPEATIIDAQNPGPIIL